MFHGACLDTGAQRCVIGLNQARAYCRAMQIPFKMKPSRVQFRFGDGTYSALGSLKISIPTPQGSSISWNFDVVKADVPMLIGLDLLDEFKLVVNNVTNKLMCLTQKWSLPIIRQLGHLYLKWSFSRNLYTKTELKKMHRHFHHPEASKMYNLIKRAKPEHATPETRAMLEQIGKACETCQVFSAQPQRFRVSLPPNKIVFNKTVAMDLMWLDKKAVLHVVDTHTHFNSAAFLRGHTVEDVWNAFLKCWATIYVGFPEKIKVDQGSCFTSLRWEKLSTDVGTIMEYSGVESHNSIGSGERYHGPLRRVFNKIKHENPKMPRELTLSLALKALNDTMGPEGLVPTLLVFGTLPRFPTVESSNAGQFERMNALESARKEYATITAELRIRKALMSRVPRTTDLVLHPGDQVRVFRETDKKYTGPYPVIRVDGKQVFVIDKDKEKQFSLHQCIPAKDFDDIASGQNHMETMHSMVKQFVSRPHHRESSPLQIHITEVLKPRDPRCSSPEATKAKQKEIAELIKRGTWKIVLMEDIPKNSNVMNGRFVMAIKDIETDKPFYKARFVVQGHRDREKDNLVHNSTTVRHSSIRTMVAMAALFGFRIWTQDVTNAYIQSASQLLREVYLRPSKEFELESTHVLKLLRPLYGLADSGDYWNATYSDHIRKDLNMELSATDMSFFFKKVRGKICGLLGTYVDDTIFCGDKQFEDITSATSKRFESKEKEWDKFRFAGVYIETLQDGFIIHQKNYIDRLKNLDKKSTFDDFRSARARLAWLIHTRPEICVNVSMMAQVTEDTFDAKHTRLYNRTLKDLKATSDTGLRMKKLDKSSLHIKVFSDSSFANNRDLSSQLGYIILLCDKFKNCNILHFSSHKSRRVVRSVLGAETYAFADAFDYAHALKHDLESILDQKIPLQMLTDSKSLFDVLTKCSSTIEKRLMIDLQVVRQAYETHLISDLGFIRTEHNPADGLTKIGTCQALRKLIATNKCDQDIDTWVLRNDTAKTSSSFERK